MMDRVHVHEAPLSRVSGQPADLMAVIAVDGNGQAYVELCDQEYPSIGAYPTRMMSFVQAWQTSQWVSQVKRLRETTLRSIAQLVTGDCIDPLDRRKLADDLGGLEDELTFVIRQHVKPQPDPDTLREILQRLPGGIRRRIGREVVDVGWIDEAEMLALLDTSEAQPSIPATPPPVEVIPTSSRRLAALRRFSRFGRVEHQHL